MLSAAEIDANFRETTRPTNPNKQNAIFEKKNQNPQGSFSAPKKETPIVIYNLEDELDWMFKMEEVKPANSSNNTQQSSSFASKSLDESSVSLGNEYSSILNSDDDFLTEFPETEKKLEHPRRGISQVSGPSDYMASSSVGAHFNGISVHATSRIVNSSSCNASTKSSFMYHADGPSSITVDKVEFRLFFIMKDKLLNSLILEKNQISNQICDLMEELGENPDAASILTSLREKRYSFCIYSIGNLSKLRFQKPSVNRPPIPVVHQVLKRMGNFGLDL